MPRDFMDAACTYRNEIIPSASVVLRSLVGSSSHGMSGAVLQSAIKIKSDAANTQCENTNVPSDCCVRSIKKETNLMSIKRPRTV